MLQWGRDLLVAERGKVAWAEYLADWLQWGRDLLVAESCRWAFLKREERGLQWGRDVLVAERMTTLTSQARQQCFNGAATC